MSTKTRQQILDNALALLEACNTSDGENPLCLPPAWSDGTGPVWLSLRAVVTYLAGPEGYEHWAYTGETPNALPAKRIDSTPKTLDPDAVCEA